MTNGSLMKVNGIAECSPWIIRMSETCRKFDIKEGFPDLGMGQTFGIFQQSENTLVCRDWLNREQNGSESSTDNSRRILLLIP